MIRYLVKNRDGPLVMNRVVYDGLPELVKESLTYTKGIAEGRIIILKRTPPGYNRMNVYEPINACIRSRDNFDPEDPDLEKWDCEYCGQAGRCPFMVDEVIEDD